MAGDQMRFINSQEVCSRGLRNILEQQGINSEFFELPIEEGPIFKIIERLTKAPCVFHIGCSTDDNRLPNIAIRIRRGKIRSANYLEFLFERTIPPDVVLANGWFRDNQGERNLERTAAALNNWRHCEETVSFICRASPGNLGLTLTITIFFEEGRLQKIWNITDLQTAPYVNKLVGFKGSSLARLANKSAEEMKRLENNLNSDDWSKVLATAGFTVESLLEQLYALFKKSSKHLHKTNQCARF